MEAEINAAEKLGIPVVYRRGIQDKRVVGGEKVAM
jgi:hypothetical protein